MSKRLLRYFFIAILAVTASPGFSQDYPSRPIKLVVPFPPGGGTDGLARLIANALYKAWGQPVVVENKAGAGGNIGMAAVAMSPADGYTIVLTNNAIATSQEFYSKQGYDLDKNFMPLGILASTPQILVTQSSLPVNSVAELIAYAKANPGKLSYASCGVGTPQHVAMELFKSTTMTDIVHVPYKGCAPITTDFIAGGVQVGVMNPTAIIPLGTKAKQLALTTAKRSSLAPALAPLSTMGMKDFDVGIWFGLMVPAGTPEVVRDKLAREVRRVMDDKEINQQITKIGMERWVTSPAEMTAVINADRKVIRQLIEQKRIVPEPN
jgi:tripartite-type tricarboxylate transporter receptor subunit TctC